MFTEAGDRLESLLTLHCQIGSSHLELFEFPNACKFYERLTERESLANHIAYIPCGQIMTIDSFHVMPALSLLTT